MSNEDKIQVEGLVVEALPGTQFRVKLDNGVTILAYLAGKMRKYYIRILPQAVFKGIGKRVGIHPYLPLPDNAILVVEDKLDRVFNCDDMFAPFGVDDVYHARKGSGFAGAGRTGDENQASGQLR